MYRSFAGSPTMQALAAEAARKTPRQSQLLSPERYRRRLELAVGIEHHDNELLWCALIALGLSLFFSFCAVHAKHEYAPAITYWSCTLSMIAFGFAGLYSRSQRWHCDRAIAAAQHLEVPFLYDGIAEYMVADRPCVDVTFRGAVERDTFGAAASAICGLVRTSEVDRSTFRLHLMPKLFANDRCGNLDMLRALVERLLVPMHEELGIARVSLGGTVEVP